MAQQSTHDTHRPHSWGRTRGPKNVARPEIGTEATTSTSLPSGVGDGYSTENQRFLHLYLNTSLAGSENRTVTVYGWNHAFGRWFPMKDVGGTDIAVTANNTEIHNIFEIAGTDRVYFKINTALHATNQFFAACSTF